MKKIIYSIMLLTIVIVSACRKSDNPAMPDGIVYLNQPTIKKVSGDIAVKDNEPDKFTAKFSVDLYFKNSEKPKYLDIVVMKNGDAKNAKVVKSEVNSFPINIDITGVQLKSLFGTIVSGDNFDIGANYITNDNKTYLAFPLGGGAPYGSTVTQQPDASPLIRYSAICGFDIDDFIGNGKFEIVEDGWGDFGAGDAVTVKKTGATQFTISAIDPAFKDFVVDVNTADNSAVIKSMLVGNEATVTSVYGGGGAYGSLTVATAGASSASFVNPCQDEIQLNVQYVFSKYGNQGAFVLKLKKSK
ncbi:MULTISPECIES: hypothetical protein [Sphingobacterium]|uniref:hypothetical protein n=1 Tax=Sphingobacterium TaxID=28453 RepID=UPI0010532A4C|nr:MULTISPECIES: hypothetical protein [unclassified Sphingobacterium]MCS3555942.1 hypothetical protein [Sphingobacterium sp. JUb21]